MYYFKIDKNEYGKIINDYNNGLSTTKIGKKYNVERITISRILKSCGIIVGRYITANNKICDIIPNDIQYNIIKLYKENTITDLMSKFNLKRHQIIHILKHNNIKRRNHNFEQKKYKVFSDYFDIIDSEDKSYFLGLLFADGCNTGKNITINLIDDDVYILEILSSKIFANHRPLYFRELNKKNNKHKNQYTLCICDASIKNRLNNIGIIKNKSLICNIPNINFNKDVFRHFLRGYFDGDGSVFTTHNGKYIHIDICGTYVFLKFITDNIKKYLNIDCGNKIYDSTSTKRIKNLKIGKKEDIRKIYHFMYNNSNYYLIRKYNIFKEYYNGN